MRISIKLMLADWELIPQWSTDIKGEYCSNCGDKKKQTETRFVFRWLCIFVNYFKLVDITE